MNSKNNKKYDPHILLLNLSYKMNLKKRDKYVALSNPSIYSTRKILKSHTKTTHLKYHLQHGAGKKKKTLKKD